MDRIILNQNGYSVREIYLDFYALIAETFAEKGYRYRKSKRDLSKTIAYFTIQFEYQTFSYNCLGDEIDVLIHKTINFKTNNGNDCWINVDEIDNVANLVTGTFDIKDITKDKLDELLSSIEEYIDYMELLIETFINVQNIDIKCLRLCDPYGEHEYECNGVSDKDQYYGKDAGLIQKSCNVDGSLNTKRYKELLRRLKKRKWYEYYTDESIENVYGAFYRFLKEYMK